MVNFQIKDLRFTVAHFVRFTVAHFVRFTVAHFVRFTTAHFVRFTTAHFVRFTTAHFVRFTTAHFVRFMGYFNIRSSYKKQIITEKSSIALNDSYVNFDFKAFKPYFNVAINCNNLIVTFDMTGIKKR